MADISHYYDNVENFKPLKEGRGPQVISQQAMEPRRIQKEGEEAKRRLEQGLHGEDPLHAFVSYIRKLKELYPSGSKAINDALYEAAMHFHDVLEYKNDPRLLNIFLELADKQPDPRETFNFMREKLVGNELPKFHLAMAAAFERAKDYQTAEAAYSESVKVAKIRGVKEDFDLAMTHLTHFKRRMARRLQESRALHGPSSPEVSRAMLASRSVQRPRLDHQQSQQQQHRGLAPPTARRPGGMPPGPTRPQFSVFDDRKAGVMGSVPRSISARPAEANWHTLETESTGVENQGPARPWTEVGTIQQRAGGRVVSAVKPPSFNIFVEPSEQEQQEQEVDEAAAQMGKLKIAPLSERQTNRVTSMFATKTPAVEEHIAVPVTPPSNPDDRTINTRMAYNDMMEMFASPSMSVARGPSAPVPIYTPAFGLANRLAVEEDEEGQNVSPNIILRPGETGTTLRRSATRTRPVSARPPLATIEHHEEGVSPSFRRELANPPPAPREPFEVFREAPSAARPTQQQHRFDAATSSDAADVTYDGGTFGISRVLAFDPSSQSERRPSRAPRMMNQAPPSSNNSFQIFKD